MKLSNPVVRSMLILSFFFLLGFLTNVFIGGFLGRTNGSYKWTLILFMTLGGMYAGRHLYPKKYHTEPNECEGRRPTTQTESLDETGFVGWMDRRDGLTKAIILIGCIYVSALVWWAPARDGSSETGSEVAIAEHAKIAPPEGISTEWLAGTWVLTPTGGEDGKTDCAAFSSPGMFLLNGQTGKLALFATDGSYRDIFIYGTPSGEQHSTATRARWRLDAGRLHFTEGSSNDAFETSWGSASEGIIRASDNVLIRDNGSGKARFVRCVGDTSEL